MSLAKVFNGEIMVCENCGKNIAVERNGAKCPFCGGTLLSKNKDNGVCREEMSKATFGNIGDKPSGDGGLAPIVRMFGPR